MHVLDYSSNSQNNTIASYSYELGANGNRLKLTEGTGRVVDYTYDNLYRLLTETVTDPINGDHSSQWAYDPVGNRLQQTIDGVVTRYTYNDNDHLLTETENSVTTSYGYDNNGNTLSKSINAVLDTSYSYSKDNRMLTAVTPTSTMAYSYDAGGIRQSQTVDGVITHFLVDPNRSYAQVLEEQDSLFVPQVIYSYGDDLINQTNAQGVHTFGYDGLGNTRVLTDVNGTVQNSYGYQAFGELDYQHGTLENSYLFTGEQYDNNVGFYYLRARFYNPSIGRFQNMDTFPGMQFEPKSLHKYLYAHADPINNIDPSGMTPLTDFINTVRRFLPGNYTMPWVLGSFIHRAVCADIQRKNRGVMCDVALPSVKGVADVVLNNLEVYEIKPLGGVIDPEEQLQRYTNGTGLIRGKTPIRGYVKAPPPIFSMDVEYYTTAEPGVIRYMPRINGNFVMSTVVAGVTAYVAANRAALKIRFVIGGFAF